VKMIGGLMLLIMVAGCIHRSPETEVLAAFRKAGLQTIQPENRVDSAAAARCASPATSVAFITRDTAIVKYFQDCAGCPGPPSCGVVRFETDYLFVRRNGNWQVERAVAGGAIQTSSLTPFPGANVYASLSESSFSSRTAAQTQAGPSARRRSPSIAAPARTGSSRSAA